MRLTRAITPIRLCDATYAKLATWDALAAAYLRLCQPYATSLCTKARPDTYASPCCASPRSQRWKRVAMQQAAGIAPSWCSTYAAAAHHDSLERLVEYQEDSAPRGRPVAGAGR